MNSSNILWSLLVKIKPFPYKQTIEISQFMWLTIKKYVYVGIRELDVLKASINYVVLKLYWAFSTLKLCLNSFWEYSPWQQKLLLPDKHSKSIFIIYLISVYLFYAILAVIRALTSGILCQMSFYHTKIYFINFNTSFYNTVYIRSSILTLHHIKIIIKRWKYCFDPYILTAFPFWSLFFFSLLLVSKIKNHSILVPIVISITKK